MSASLGPAAQPQDLLWPSTCGAVCKGLVPASAVQLSFVGRVERLQVGQCYSDFALDDSTGRVWVRLFHGGAFTSGTPLGLPAGYVRVVGRLAKTSPTYVITESVRGIAGADEIPHHLVEAAQAFLLNNERPPLP